jgi:serine/threonine protein kinase
MLGMELCKGSLRKNSGNLEEPLFLKIMLHACLGLKVLHDEDTLHLDLKPSNILEGFKGEFKLCDLGHSRAIADIGDEIPEGDQRYLSKELICQNQTKLNTDFDLKRSDIFALGCTAYELIEGVKLPKNGI